jgi:hypothetical protein
MQLPALLTSDLHLTAAPRDAYRWTLFDYLEDQCRVEEVKTLCILGDLTDAKDYHPSSLTNRIVEQVVRMRKVVDEVLILQGNHDYLRAGHAYFEFLNHIPGVRFIVKPYEDLGEGVPTLWLPHTKTPATDWAGLDTTHYEYVFMHQTVGGAVASNGQKMDGENVPDLSAWGKVYSGDIHVPQVIKGVEYVGSPYHVHFGDAFDPRLVLIDRRNRPVDLKFECVRRTTVTVSTLADLKHLRFKAGDQVKLRFDLTEAEKHDWRTLRKAALEHLKYEQVEVEGVELRVQKVGAALKDSAPRITSINPADAVYRFCATQELGGDALDLGLGIVE